MLHTRFQASEASGYEEDFLIFSTYFYGSNLGLSKCGHFGPQGHPLIKLGRGPLGNATYYI